MFVKIVTISLIAIAARTAGETVWNGLVASWDIDPSNNFYKLPQTLEAAKDEGWKTVKGVNPPKNVVALGYYGDPTLVLLFSKKVVGFQIAIPISMIAPEQPIKYDEVDAFILKKLNGALYWTFTTYFSEDESTGVRKIAIQEKHRLFKIPTNASQVPLETPFLLKKCIPTMGLHYYTWNVDSDCATLNPAVPLSVGGNIIGLALQVFATLTPIGNRTWWEVLPANALYAAMDDPPICAVDAIDTYGPASLHVWFVDEPQSITCPQ